MRKNVVFVVAWFDFSQPWLWADFSIKSILYLLCLTIYFKQTKKKHEEMRIIRSNVFTCTVNTHTRYPYPIIHSLFHIFILFVSKYSWYVYLKCKQKKKNAKRTIISLRLAIIQFGLTPKDYTQIFHLNGLKKGNRIETNVFDGFCMLTNNRLCTLLMCFHKIDRNSALMKSGAIASQNVTA